MKFILSLFTLIFFTIASAIAAPGKQKVEVRDMINGEPIAGATLHFSGQHYISNAQGIFEIDNAAGSEARITAVGYKETKTKIVATDEIISISLMPLAGQLGDVVVSASLRPMSRMASPIPVESYNARYFKRNPTPSLI
jgi:outer membrane receptor for ferrienterochelin and colicins